MGQETHFMITIQIGGALSKDIAEKLSDLVGRENVVPDDIISIDRINAGPIRKFCTLHGLHYWMFHHPTEGLDGKIEVWRPGLDHPIFNRGLVESRQPALTAEELQRFNTVEEAVTHLRRFALSPPPVILT
jgi:hypothetical protein